MNSIRQDINEYLEMRRALGFELRPHGKALEQFACFFENADAKFITTKLCIEWAEQARSLGSISKRLGYVRAFARFRSASDPRTEIPPDSLYPYVPKRAKPYIYSDSDITKLLDAARKLPNSFRGETYRTLFGLLAVTGLRIGELLGLDAKNVDLVNGIITVVGAKHGRTRLIPLHRSSQIELITYSNCREKFLNGKPAAKFFISLTGNKLDIAMVHRTFYALSEAVGLRKSGDKTGPRIHDFRHAFAVKTMLRWYRCGADIDRRLPLLSAYLGHVHVSDTYWYLSTMPELMDMGVNLLATRWEEKE